MEEDSVPEEETTEDRSRIKGDNCAHFCQTKQKTLVNYLNFIITGPPRTYTMTSPTDPTTRGNPTAAMTRVDMKAMGQSLTLHVWSLT